MSAPIADDLQVPTRHWRYAYLSVFAFALFLYGDLLLMPGTVVPSHLFADICNQFVQWRRFGFGELAKGNIPLWNPYVFCGSPFLGNNQSAVLYPINVLLYPFLPVAKGINAEILLHITIVGASTLAWVRNRGARPLAATLAAAIVMAGAPVCLRINLGQLNVLAVFAWLPLTLLAIDKLFERISAGWMLVAIFAIAMQLQGGYPPVLYNNAFAVTVYCALRLIRHPHRLRTIATLALLGVVPLLISAGPLAAGYHTMRESLRSEGTSFAFASSWSLPPENLLTALTPLFYGDYTHVNYWGRWCLWDACIFIGFGSLLLLFYGAVYAPRQSRKFAGTLLVLLLLTALGRYTPFYTILYYCVPGISSFRAPSKFLLPALVFAAMLTGLGADAFLMQPQRARRFTIIAATCAACLLAIGAALQSFPSILDAPYGLWTLLVAGVEQSGEAYWWTEMDALAMDESVWIASVSAFVGAAACILVAYLLSRAQRRSYRLALVCFSIAEVLCFSRYTRVTVDIAQLTNDDLVQLRESDPGDYREVQAKSINPNWRRNFPTDIRMKTVWGYDPVLLKRYATFFAYALGGAEHQEYLTYDVEITNIADPMTIAIMRNYWKLRIGAPKTPGAYPTVQLPNLFRLMRCKYVYFWPEPSNGLLGGIHGVHEARDPFPRAAIYRDYRVVSDPDSILTQMTSEDIDLKHTLFLESAPNPAPTPEGNPAPDDRVAVHDDSTDQVSLDVYLATPGILFLTDAYSNGWTATALPGSVQQNYEILPADYAFQAIPLTAGNHKIRLEYAPAIVIGGMWVSAIALTIYLLACATWFLVRFRKRAQPMAAMRP